MVREATMARVRGSLVHPFLGEILMPNTGKILKWGVALVLVGAIGAYVKSGIDKLLESTARTSSV
jgi:hypothetical protein